MPAGKRHCQPEHPQPADAKHRDEGGHPHIPAAAQRAGKNFDCDVGQVGGRQKVHHLNPLGNHARIVGKQAEQRFRRQIHDGAHHCGTARRHGQTDACPLPDPVIETCAEVLPCKGGDGNPKGVDRHPEQKINFSVDAPRRHRSGAKPVDGTLDEHIAHAVQCALGRSGQTNAADALQHAPFQPQLFRTEMPGHSLGTRQAAQCENHADALAEHRGCRRPRHAPGQHRHKEQVQPDIDQRGNDEEVQRTAGIPHRTQKIGAHIVEGLGNHAQKVDAQIQHGKIQNLRRGPHEPHHPGADGQAQYGEHRTAHGSQRQSRVNLTVHSLPVPRAIALSHQNPRATAQTHKNPQ